MKSTAQTRRATLWSAAAVFAVSLLLYTVTLAPGLLWGGGDFAMYQTRAYLLDIFSQMSIFDHSLWVLLAHPFTWLPVRDAAWRANFASAIFASSALVFVYLSARKLARANAAALLGTAALAVSHTFWTYAVMPKVYSLNALLLAVCVFLLLKWRESGRNRFLFAFAFILGVSPLNHLVTVVVGLGYAAFVLMVLLAAHDARRLWQSLLGAAAFLLLGLSPYLVLLLARGTAGTTSGTIVSWLGGLVYAVANPAALAAAVEWGVLLGAYQFPLTGLLGLLGLVTLWRSDRPMFALILGAIVGTVAFLMAAADPGPGNVYIWNLHYYLQAYVPFGLALAVGFDRLWFTRWFAGPMARAALALATVLLPVALYAASPILVRQVWADVPDFRPLPGRDNFVYVLAPWKQQETGARTLGDSIMRTLPPDSVIFADYSIWAVLNYLQVVEGQRPDVTLVNLGGVTDQLDAIRAYGDADPLYLADTYRYYDLARIEAAYALEADEPIFRLVAK